MMLDYLPYLLIAAIAVVFASSAIRILREYQRGVIFTLGRFTGVKGPGLIILVPFVQQMVKVDLRVVVHNVPPQDVITRDNVTVKVNAVIYFRVVEPRLAVTEVSNFLYATSQLAQTTLRSVFGREGDDGQAAVERALALAPDLAEARAQTISKVPLGRYGTAEEVANLVHFLCSDLAANITGAQYVVDGGRTATGGAVTNNLIR